MDECEGFRHDMWVAAAGHMMDSEQTIEDLRSRLSGLNRLLDRGKRLVNEQDKDSVWSSSGGSGP